ncbi:hypothetical protein C8A05DRAFT_17401 [Staphylotrichum tortipilum]|uniref:Uncharacterized protein n=1 Tax=Staphylotrichum tortipilum TaxID=2831512 RepID=A0AAN6MHM7_9PEZI|nr:hypothetical protein C8A05DRAFT_17401 [Staphylotrichum longicolle]
MATQPDFDILPDHASLDTSRSRTSIVASLRRRTSRLLGRHGAVTPAPTPDNTPQPIHTTPPSKSKRNWINSVGARFRRTDRTALGSSDSSQDAHVELRETADTPKSASSPHALPVPQQLIGRHRRLFSSGRTRLHSLPARIRRRGSSIFRRASSSSLSDEGKENFVERDPGRTPSRPTSSANTANTGSWSSFRSGVQRAVRGE